MKRSIPVLILFGLCATPIRADNYPRNPDIDIIHYVFRLSLSDASDVISGRTTVEVRFVVGGVEQFALDLIGPAGGDGQTGMSVERVTSAGNPVSFTHQDNRLRLRLATPPRANERRSFEIVYQGQPADGLVISNNRHGERTFFGDNFPNRTRHWLPTLDHPYDKATCEFIVTAPERYSVIASGLQIEETSLDQRRRLTHWRQSVPISTYLMVIGVARFAVQTVDTVDGVAIETWVFAQDRDEGFYDFARARRPLDFFSAHVGPYSYEKLANVQSKTRWGGMENSSNIFYSERSVNGRRRVEGTMTHEIAHQWFGDSVTTADWNHVWLSEGFATYFTQLFNEFTFGRDRMVEGMKSNRDRVVNYFANNPDARIVDPRVPVERILSAYTYQKGGWVLHMLRRRIGDEKFWAGIREYYRQYQNRNALSEDFQRVMEAVSGQDLEGFFRQWLYEPGHPQLEGSWEYDVEEEAVLITIEQAQTVGPVFNVPLDIGFHLEGESQPRVETVRLNQRRHTFSFSLNRPPTLIELDPHTWLLMEARFSRRD